MGPLKHKIDSFFFEPRGCVKVFRAAGCANVDVAKQPSGVGDVGFSCSWLEIPGNVIYITSQPNHSARNPSSKTNHSVSCLWRQKLRRETVQLKKKKKKKRCKSWWRREGCRWGQREKGKKGTDCRCLSEYTSARQSRFTPSSLCHYGTHF